MYDFISFRINLVHAVHRVVTKNGAGRSLEVSRIAAFSAYFRDFLLINRPKIDQKTILLTVEIVAKFNSDASCSPKSLPSLSVERRPSHPSKTTPRSTLD